MIGFLNPWLLLALGALPALWWLLRTVPPRPRTISFPPTRMLKDLENRKQTPARTPWWLMLIRMLAAALVIGALGRAGAQSQTCRGRCRRWPAAARRRQYLGGGDANGRCART